MPPAVGGPIFDESGQALRTHDRPIERVEVEERPDVPPDDNDRLHGSGRGLSFSSVSGWRLRQT